MSVHVLVADRYHLPDALVVTKHTDTHIMSRQEVVIAPLC